MKKTPFFGKTLLAVLILCGQNELTASAGVPDDSIAFTQGIKDKFGSAVFTVHAYQKMLPSKTGEKSIKKRRNVGTAFPLDKSGYFITPSCVVRDAEKIEITGRGNEKFTAVTVGFDVNGKIAVLKSQHQILFPLPTFKPLNSVKPGSKIVFLGIPPGKSLTSMMGVVESVNGFDGTIIVTVPAEPGTSGTPVFDENGQIVGLLAYQLSARKKPAAGSLPPKDFYAVYPMEYVSLVARSIIQNSTSRGGWLGISVEINGGSIHNVVKNSPADKCGIKTGDIIVELNSSAVSSPDDLIRMMGAAHSGDTIHLKVLRDGEPLALTVKLSEHPPMK